MTVPDKNEAALDSEERGERSLRREDVLPDRVAWASMEEADAGPLAGRLERAQEGLGLGFEDGPRPARACRSLGSEEVERDPIQGAEVMVADERDGRDRLEEHPAAVRTRAVPYEVAEEPDLVGSLGLDRRENSLERMEIRMDVGDDGGPHRRLTLPQGLVGAGLLAVCLAAGVLLWQTEVPDLELPSLDPGALFPAAELDRIADYRRVSRALFLGSLALELAVVAVVAVAARPLAARLRRLTRGAVRTGLALVLVAVLSVWLAQLPLGATSHWWQRRYGLSRQGYDGWLWDSLTGLGIRIVLVAIAVAGAMLLWRRFGRRWWLAGGPALVAIAVGFVLVQPLVVQPLLNDFRPLRDGALAAEIERLAAAEGVDIDRVEVADASRRTTTANAYVAGIGPTRRVVLWDTILDGRFPRGEIVSVAAHELAHVGRRHLWKGLAWFALLAVPGVAIVAWATGRRGGLGDPAAVPLGLLAALLVYLATLPLQNAVSRRYEAEADWIALQATKAPEDAVALERRFVRTSLAQPDPPDVLTFWFGTHPPPIDRIAMAYAYVERTTGRSPGGS
jgi:Zn-dependent protease with chaperone function